MLQIAFVGAFAARLQGLVQDRVGVPCQVIAVDEAAIMSKLADLDVLVTLVFNRETPRRAAGSSSCRCRPPVSTGSTRRHSRPASGWRTPTATRWASPST